eukprot:5046_1
MQRKTKGRRVFEDIGFLEKYLNDKKRNPIKPERPIVAMDDDGKLIHFQGNTWSLTDEDACSSESEAQYEHVRLKSVHESKKTPHNIKTPNGTDDRDLEYIANKVFNEPTTPHTSYNNDNNNNRNDYEFIDRR